MKNSDHFWIWRQVLVHNHHTTPTPAPSPTDRSTVQVIQQQQLPDSSSKKLLAYLSGLMGTPLCSYQILLLVKIIIIITILKLTTIATIAPHNQPLLSPYSSPELLPPLTSPTPGFQPQTAFKNTHRKNTHTHKSACVAQHKKATLKMTPPPPPPQPPA